MSATEPRGRVPVLTPVMAGLATVAASTALTGVVDGARWLGYVLVAVLFVTSTGFGLRSLRMPAVLVAFGQLVVLGFLVFAVFTRSGVLGFLPGPAAIEELGTVLGAAGETIRTGLPPVPSDAPILCLVTIAIGLVAVLVDTLAVTALAPAATGLVLLCVYAVPASLANAMLPWWTFLLGAGCFAMLLAVDGGHRRLRQLPRSGSSARGLAHMGAGSGAVVCVAILLGLAAGGQLTMIGTEGRLPGAGEGTGAGSGRLGIKPFTALRGMLDRSDNTELFRVRGLGNDARYLRTLTLNNYRPNVGWEIKGGMMPRGSDVNGPLPLGPGESAVGDVRRVRIEPTNWQDYWLPVYGLPRQLSNLGDNWRYDPDSGTVYSQRAVKPRPYQQTAVVNEPSASQLRASRADPASVAPVYTERDGIDSRVARLAKRLTASARSDFGKVSAIWRYFTPSNGFSYDTQTAKATDSDAIADFVLNGKRGFCEQYASAMAVMLRAVGIPSRVAIGFTSGYTTGDYRSISTRDAHAWVEVFFRDEGWVTFDPTPLSDGRGYVPDYLRQQPPNPPPPEQTEPPSATPSPQPAPDDAAAPPFQPPRDQRPPGGGSSLVWLAATTGLLAVLLTAAAIARGRRGTRPPGSAVAGALVRWLPALAAGSWMLLLMLAGALVSWWLAVAFLVLCLAALPSLVREFARRRRLHAITALGADAPEAAWRELLAECADRGESLPTGETVRTVARRIASQHELDEDGKANLRVLVSEVERAWYGADQPSGTELARAFDGVRRALRRHAPLALRARLFPRSILPARFTR